MRINNPNITSYQVFLEYLNCDVPKIHLIEEIGWKDGSIHDFIDKLSKKQLINLYYKFKK